MKRITLLFAILATAIGAKAQQETGSWSITPRVGVNSSVLTMDDVQYMNASGNIETSKAQHRWGLTAGVEAQYQCWSQIAHLCRFDVLQRGLSVRKKGRRGRVEAVTAFPEHSPSRELLY